MKNRTRRLVTWVLISAVIGPYESASAASKGASFEGEIVDVACYVGLQQKGHQHGKCTKTCLLDGAPIGLISGDRLYLLLEDTANPKPYQLVKQAPAEHVRVSGKILQRGGIQTLVVQEATVSREAPAACSDQVDPTAVGSGYCGESGIQTPPKP